MTSFLNRLLDTQGFPPRWYCGEWSEAHGWLHILSDIAIFGAYSAIPTALVYFIVRRKDVPFGPIFWLFGLFIISCGFTHLIDATIFWHPWYRLSGAVKSVTAVASWLTVIALFRVLPSALALPALANDNRQLTALIAERELAQAALRSSEEFKRSIIESSPDCIQVLDLEGTLISFEAGHHLLGSPDITPLLGTSWVDLWVREEDRSLARTAVAAAKAGGEGKFIGFYPAPRGVEKWWSVAVTPVRDHTSQPTRLLAVWRDVTEQRALENALIARAEELARADRSKDEFLAMLAHELRNPLASLRNAAEILESPGVSAEEHAMAQPILRRQIDNMRRMIDDLLDVSRITHGKIMMRFQPVSLGTVVRGVASAARQNCITRQQELRVNLPAQPVFLMADATRLEQVLSNLVNNACKYSGDGSLITLSAEVAAPADAAPEVVVRVGDNGIGIEPELLPYIFEPFVQSTRSLDRAHGGLGIGLTLVKRLVEQHGGRVEVHSDGPGRGTEFAVHLPILLDESKLIPSGREPTRREPPRRMLIVDDNTDAARSLEILQKRRGHETRTAFTGPDAVTAAAEFHPEVVLLDIGLPGMDGFSVARQLRAMPGLGGALIIGMSGYGREEDMGEAKLAGFDEYLTKPIDLAKLSEWVRTRL